MSEVGRASPWQPVTVAAVAIALRLAAQVALGFHTDPIGFEEDLVARNMLSGRGYVYDLNGAEMHALRAPTYSFVLAGIYSLFGSGTVPVAAAQALLGGALAALAWAIGERLHRGVGALAGLGAAADPALLVYSARIHPINLEAVLFLAGILVLLRHRGSETRLADPALLGAIAGIDLLTRPTFVPALTLGALAAAILHWRRGTRAALATLAIVWVVTMAMVAPWIVRNYAILGVPTLTSTTGLTLWLGNNPSASGGTITAEGVSILDAVPEVRSRIWGKSELDQDAILTQAALSYMASDPVRTAEAYFSKFATFWLFSPQTGALYPREWVFPAIAFRSLLLAGTVTGLAVLIAARRWWAAYVLLSALVVTAAAQAIFYVDGRHSFAVEPALIVVSAFGVATVLSKLRMKGRAING